jgi:hypothetical protein
MTDKTSFRLTVFSALLCAALFFSGTHPTQAGNPIGDFFKRVGNSIAHPQNKGTKRPTTTKPTTAKGPNAKPAAGDPAVVVTNPNAPSVVTAPAPSATPSSIRTALRAPASDGRRDLPYGVPAPNKPGFVTSPYAPTRGLVDVRGFPSGTEVKDPYTDKIFLAP